MTTDISIEKKSWNPCCSKFLSVFPDHLSFPNTVSCAISFNQCQPTKTQKCDSGLILANLALCQQPAWCCVSQSRSCKWKNWSRSRSASRTLPDSLSVCSMPVLFVMAFNENQLWGSLNQLNMNNFWHFSGDLLKECRAQLLQGVRVVRMLAKVSSGQMGVLRMGV